ncbi:MULTISPECIES: acetyl-CoA C-acetyltransferase [Rhizobium/Agrobacterium group]|jgi:acetyl-CoA C-acetyltransferase|uniref:acetyl-CoA C-acetyltransferase n=1 Tax=Rhizobium/Agrobacterium group TaxID=227290 RepID=UPI0007141834|nr:MULTISPECIES: acetyl-CoA C-acetyltransferase [Rhizobium/Agrobacterium group]KRA66655.1 acetyl-CoA acetyltransferase [Rhizobium sp. Root651]MBA4799760.1 acetyl-CoA C-acetyltransferase [Hyphomicrobiales bacterium]MDH1270908.1 acetyl-CoA C-acetyltransferase [Agrobacterium pusense]
MKDAFIVSPLRTPIGRFGGALRPLTADALMVHIIQALLKQTGIPPETIGDVVASQSYASSEAPCIGRYGALAAGLPIEVPGFTLDRRCGSGLQAVVTAAMQVQTGQADAVLAVGVESMSNIEFYTTDMRWGHRMGSVQFHDRLDRGRVKSQPVERFGQISGMPETADNLARDYGISREEADAFAVRSHQLAAAAWREKRFESEVVPVAVPGRKGETTLFAQDEGIREDSNEAQLARLPTLLPQGVCTAGNSSQQNDASAACLVVSEDYLKQHDLQPMARLAGWSAVGVEPNRMGIGPVPATRRVLERTGVSLDRIDLIELNEAFATQALAVLKALEIDDFDRVNVNGSGISLGHPIGATGIRMLATLLHEMDRRKARYGLESMCIGGGMGMAALFERV